MTGVDDDDAALGCFDGRMMRSFPSDQRVDVRRLGLSQDICRGARAGADRPVTGLVPGWNLARAGAAMMPARERVRDRSDRVRGHVRVTRDANWRALIRGE